MHSLDTACRVLSNSPWANSVGYTVLTEVHWNPILVRLMYICIILNEQKSLAKSRNYAIRNPVYSYTLDFHAINM